MVKIRLRRMGKRGRPSYRVVVADIRNPRNGKFIEVLGYYDPIAEPTVFNVDLEKTKEWILKGAQPTDTVRRLLSQVGLDLNNLKG
ncbi:MAG: 30S ribosomal protein S16 [bacterium]